MTGGEQITPGPGGGQNVAASSIELSSKVAHVEQLGGVCLFCCSINKLSR